MRDFALLSRDEDGRAIKLETHRLAENEKAFWTQAAAARKTDQERGERFIGFLQRVMLHAAPLSAPGDVAWFLASYARDALARIEGAPLRSLSTVRSALEEALGLRFEGRKGDHFFRSSLVQTLFYGVFSAWVLWWKQTRRDSSSRFDWKSAAWYLRVPMISKLFYLVADPTQLDPLRLSEVLDWTAQVLNRVQPEFFSSFQETQAVQYFYEPFLEAFDPDLRKQLGVWYTPPEVVKYMVERIDTVLREDLKVPLGLADKSFYVLDPCCGTGSYIIEVLDRIHRTLKARGADALLASDLKDAAQSRIVGFEILPAPFVVSHLQLGLLLQNLGAPLSDRDNERAGIYLTNSLTGWEPPKGAKQHLIFPELEEERDRAERVKQDVPILVVLGNPPYNAFAGVSPAEEEGLVEPYKKGLISEWGIKKFNLDDLYIRFFRLAERRIAEKTGRGIVCYISNFSYLSEPSFVVMRRRFLSEFDKLWFDCMNGDSRETGKLTPDGKPDPSVFSTQYNREGIRKGTAIALMVRTQKRGEPPAIRFRHFWGVTKRSDLLSSLEAEDWDAQYRPVKPDEDNRYSFRAQAVTDEYLRWPKLTGFCAVPPFNGPVERRGNSLIVFEGEEDKLALLKDYLDKTKSDEEIRSIAPSFMKSSGEFKAEQARKALKNKARYDERKIVRYPFKPFDMRFAYLDAEIQPLFSRPSPELLAQGEIAENCFFITRDTADKNPEGPPFYFSHFICDYDCISGHARHFPILISSKGNDKQVRQRSIRFENEPPVANLSTKLRNYLAKLGITNPDAGPESAEIIWMHALAVGFCPAYLIDNADGIRQDWPRVPLPGTRKALLASAALGRQIAALLDMQAGTKVAHQSSLSAIAAFTVTDQPLNEAKHFALTANWGSRDKRGCHHAGHWKNRRARLHISREARYGRESHWAFGRTHAGYIFE